MDADRERNGEGKVILSSETRTFAIASDEALVGLIAAARTRLIVIAPALTKPVADALARRLDDLDRSRVTIILDFYPEVYRLGFGDQEALEVIRTASAKNMFDLLFTTRGSHRVVVADGTTLDIRRSPENIGWLDFSWIVLMRSSCTEVLSIASPRQPAETMEVVTKATAPRKSGNVALDPTRVQEMQENLKLNPPKPFDITRKLNVFSSMVQYVEFSASNYRLTTKQIPLPPEFVDVADDNSKKRIAGRIRAPFDGIGKVKIILDQDGKQDTLEVDVDWLMSIGAQN